jgi:hypothetical protein
VPAAGTEAAPVAGAAVPTAATAPTATEDGAPAPAEPATVPVLGPATRDDVRPHTLAGSAPAAGPAPSAAADRLMQVVERLAQAAPPRHLTVELPELDGVRVQVALRGSEVVLRIVGGETSGDAFGSLEQELGRALQQRGFDLAGAGGGPAGRRDRSADAPDADDFGPAAPSTTRSRPAWRADRPDLLRI